MPYQLLKNARLHLETTHIMKNGLVSWFHGNYCCHADGKRLDWCYQTGNGSFISYSAKQGQCPDQFQSAQDTPKPSILYRTF